MKQADSINRNKQKCNRQIELIAINHETDRFN